MFKVGDKVRVKKEFLDKNYKNYMFHYTNKEMIEKRNDGKNNLEVLNVGTTYVSCKNRLIFYNNQVEKINNLDDNLFIL
jgi:hypothetical protein